jgi:Domain of unknown function (DUF4326)
MTYLTAARITLSRAKGWRMPENTVKVDRSTCYGNPWRTGAPGLLHLRTMPSGYHARLPIDQASAVEAFRLWMTEKPAWWMLPPPDYFTVEGWQSLWDFAFVEIAGEVLATGSKKPRMRQWVAGSLATATAA